MTQTAVQMPTYACVPRLWPGETCVIVGGGSSLRLADVRYCFGKARVIAIKEAAFLAPWADVLYACDEKWWRHYKGAPEFLGLKYALEPQSVEWPGVKVLRATGTDGIELDPSGLRTGYNSGFQAVNLAVHFGITKVILLGFDMWRGPEGRQNWFEKPGLHVDSPYPIFHQAFASVVEPLKALGVEVLNASRFTVLNAFPRVALEDVL
jgi:hypothetical protein